MSETSSYYDAEDSWLADDTLEMEGDPVLPPSPSPPPPPTPLPSEETVATRTSSRREELEALLNQHFHLDNFIPNQYEAINATINNENILLVLPSGHPRNLCYQLPVLYPQQQSNSITIILVPTLLHLLEQDNYLLEIHQIPTLFVSKSKDIYRKNWISRQRLSIASTKNTKLLYITYDDFSSTKTFFSQIHNQNLISRIIFDEAHCISQWGDDFHFGYLRAAEYIRNTFLNIPISLFTAIPNERIHIDIMNSLSLTHCKIFKKSILI